MPCTQNACVRGRSFGACAVIAAQRVDGAARGFEGDRIPPPAHERSPSHQHLSGIAHGGVHKKTAGGSRRSDAQRSPSVEPPVRRTGWSADEKQNLVELVDEIKPTTSEDWAVRVYAAAAVALAAHELA